MSTGVHPLTEWCLSEKRGRRPEVLVIRRGLLVRLFGFAGGLLFAVGMWHVMELDCATVTHRRGGCYAIQWAWPYFYYLAGYVGMLAVTGLFDPRPFLLLDEKGMRFRWVGTIPWAEIGSARVPKSLHNKRVGNQYLRIELKDKERFLKTMVRRGNIFQKLIFALHRLPFSFLLVTPFGLISLMETGISAFHLADWINEHVSDDTSPADADQGTNPGIVMG